MRKAWPLESPVLNASMTPAIASERYRMPSGPRLLLWVMAFCVTGLILLPIAYLVVRALQTDASAWTLLLRSNTLMLIWRTILLAFSVTLCSSLIAVPLAWLTSRTDLPWRSLWGTVLPLPLVIPSYVFAYLFASAFGPRGMVHQALGPLFNLERLPSIYGFWGATIVLTLLCYPYVYLSVRAAMHRLDPAFEEASRSLGAGKRATFRRVTLPLLRPALGAGALLVALYALRDFGAVSIMRYSTLTSAIFVQYRSFDRSMAALYALLLVLLCAGFLLAEARFQQRAMANVAAPGVARTVHRLALKRWKIPALIYCALVSFFSLVLPALLLLYWLVRGISAGESVPLLGKAMWNSILASGLAAGAVILAALPVVLLVQRAPGMASKLIERITWVSGALPGIVVALAFVFFAANQAPWLYQTLALLVIAYVVLFFPQGAGALRTSIGQIHPSLEEAARGLGARSLSLLRTVTLPLMRPGLIAAASMAFLSTMKELPATLILAPIEFRTLATVVWSSVSEAFFAAAAAPALLILFLSSLPMIWIMLRHGDNTRV